MNHNLRPWIRVFHADVPRGSEWTLLPDRFGPIRSHLIKRMYTHSDYVRGEDAEKSEKHEKVSRGNMTRQSRYFS